MRLAIDNFKSVRNLQSDLRRVSVLIGPPGEGKSNILEALGLLACLQARDHRNLAEYVRLQDVRDLAGFQDQDQPTRVQYSTLWATLEQDGEKITGQAGTCPLEPGHRRLRFQGRGKSITRLELDHQAEREAPREHPGECPRLRFYRFTGDPEWDRRPEHQLLPYATGRERPRSKSEPRGLLPPTGRNLPYMIRNHRWLNRIAESLLGNMSPPMALAPEGTGLGLEEVRYEDRTAVPDQLMPASIRKYLLTLAAITTNRDSTVILEDPEEGMHHQQVHHLAESIGLDDRHNRYIITTRSNKFLIPLVSKTHRDEISLHPVRRENGNTVMGRLRQEALPELFERNIFTNRCYYHDETDWE